MVHMGVKWTVLHVHTGTVGRDRRRDLRCIHGTHGSQVDCPTCPNWYSGQTEGDKVYTHYMCGLSYTVEQNGQYKQVRQWIEDSHMGQGNMMANSDNPHKGYHHFLVQSLCLKASLQQCQHQLQWPSRQISIVCTIRVGWAAAGMPRLSRHIIRRRVLLLVTHA